ncbi:hypothetical protein BH23CHL2_BH23CHL2_11470 [soil metagenome]
MKCHLRIMGYSGQSLVEYALIIMLIALVVIAALGGLGTTLAGYFQSFAGMF